MQLRGLLDLVFLELGRTVQRPGRVLSVFDRARSERWLRAMAFERLHREVQAPWAQVASSELRVRSYSRYADYVRHQRGKLPILDLSEYDRMFREALAARLRERGVVKPGMAVLCLAARIGTEVKAFGDLGCFAVGIDLQPGKDNKYVLPGDFHALQFPDACVDVVFTNSLDHALDLPRLVSETRRVLKPGGYLVFEAMRGDAEGGHFGTFEATRWPTVAALTDAICIQGFELVQRVPFDGPPWTGEHVVVRSAA